MKKLLFFTPSFGNGGSERVIYHLLNKLNKSKYNFVVIAHKKEGWYLDKLNSDLKIYDLKGNRNKIKVLFEIYRILRIEKPEIVFSTTTALNSLMGFIFPLIFKRIKFISRESIVLSHSRNIKSKKYLKTLLKISQKNVDLIIAQSEDMQIDMIKNFKSPKKKVIKINNPIDIEKIDIELNKQESTEFERDKKSILCVGRLTYQKGYDLLIEAMKFVDNQRIKLYIMGQGELEQELKELVYKYKLEEKVFFLGARTNPYIYMKNADLFILSSRYEGFPNVLLEANACGKFALVNDCPGGINEIIEEGLNGSIIDFRDSQLVAKKIQKLVEKDHDEEKIKEFILSKYHIDKILNKYEEVFNSF